MNGVQDSYLDIRISRHTLKLLQHIVRQYKFKNHLTNNHHVLLTELMREIDLIQRSEWRKLDCNSSDLVKIIKEHRKVYIFENPELLEKS